MAQDIFIWGL